MSQSITFTCFMYVLANSRLKLKAMATNFLLTVISMAEIKMEDSTL